MGSAGRLGYLDWARGFCVLFMIQTHAFYAWVRPEDRTTTVFGLTRLVGGFPGAIFLFLSGLVLALSAESAHRRGAPSREVLRHGLGRGLEILGFAFLFRLWMLVSSHFWRPRDFLRVDVLNCIGASLVLAAALSFGWRSRQARLLSSLALAATIALLTPFAWDHPAVGRLAGPVRDYLSGRGADSIYPLFPWGAFTACGAAAGQLLSRARTGGWEGRLIAAQSALGAALIPLALFLDARFPWTVPRYDFWHTSPAYTLFKLGIVLVVVGVAYVWDRLPGPSPLRQMGRTSLIIYWVHLEIVYGSYVAPWARESLTLGGATAGVVLLTLAMFVLSVLRTHGLSRWPWWRDALAKA